VLYLKRIAQLFGFIGVSLGRKKGSNP